jgi:hypothetical protein
MYALSVGLGMMHRVTHRKIQMHEQIAIVYRKLVGWAGQTQPSNQRCFSLDAPVYEREKQRLLLITVPLMSVGACPCGKSSQPFLA